MKTNTAGNPLPYTTTARNVSFDDATISIKWGESDIWESVSLNGSEGVPGLKAWMLANPRHQKMMPIRVTSAAGAHSLYPCIIASTPEAAKALGVEVGEGRTFATQWHARKEHYALFMAGIKIDPADCKWGLTPARPIAATQPELPIQPQNTETVEEANKAIFG